MPFSAKMCSQIGAEWKKQLVMKIPIQIPARSIEDQDNLSPDALGGGLAQITFVV